MIEALLRYLGVEDECTLTTIDPLYTVEFPDGFRLTAPIGLEAFIEAHIQAASRTRPTGIRAFFGLRRQMFLEAAQMPMSLDPRQLGDAMEKFPTLFKYRTATLQTVLDDHSDRPQAQGRLLRAVAVPGDAAVAAVALRLLAVRRRARRRPVLLHGQLPEARRRVRDRGRAQRRRAGRQHAGRDDPARGRQGRRRPAGGRARGARPDRGLQRRRPPHLRRPDRPRAPAVVASSSASSG